MSLPSVCVGNGAKQTAWSIAHASSNLTSRSIVPSGLSDCGKTWAWLAKMEIGIRGSGCADGAGELRRLLPQIANQREPAANARQAVATIQAQRRFILGI